VAWWAAEAVRHGRPAALRRIPNARLVYADAASGTPMAPLDLRQAVSAEFGFAVGLDPVDRESAALVASYHREGRHDWSALARGCPRPDLLASRPWMAVAEEAIGSEIWSFLGARLPSHMIPAKVRVVDQLPLTTSGKIDRVGLAQGAPAGADLPQVTEPSGAADAGGSASQLDLVIELMSGLLDSAIEPDDDFVESGGGSLDAARLAGLLWSRWGWSITPGQVHARRRLNRLLKEDGRAECGPDGTG